MAARMVGGIGFENEDQLVGYWFTERRIDVGAAVCWLLLEAGQDKKHRWRSRRRFGVMRS